MDLTIEKNKLMKDCKFVPKNCRIAGGAITSVFSNKPINDFDMYFHSQKDFEIAVEDAYSNGLWCVAVSNRAITFKKQDAIYQFMCFRWFETAESIFDSFDFTACMGAFNLDTEQFELHPRFLIDLARRDLVFNHRTAYPLASGMRAMKYQGKGFSLDRRNWLKLVTAISFQKIESWEQLKDQIGGQYGEQIAMDTDKPFCLESAMKSLESGPIERNSDVDSVTEHEDEKLSEIPANAEEAFLLIFKRRIT